MIALPCEHELNEAPVNIESHAAADQFIVVNITAACCAFYYTHKLFFGIMHCAMQIKCVIHTANQANF